MLFFYQFSDPGQKNRRLLLFTVKSILYGIWSFRNNATFHKGKEKSRGIIRYLSRDIRNRTESDRLRFSPDKYLSGLIPLFVIFVITITLFFSLIDYVNISYDPGSF